MLSRALVTTLTIAVIAGCAATPAQQADDDHTAHHAARHAAAETAPAPVPRATTTPEAFDRQIKAMQDMQQRMREAKTPAERAALLDEHMALMRSGMAMMQRMRGAGMAGTMGMHKQMEQRVTMLEEMMRMMVEREATAAP